MFYINVWNLIVGLLCENPQLLFEIQNYPFLEKYFPFFSQIENPGKIWGLIILRTWHSPWIIKRKKQYIITFDQGTSIEDIITLLEYCCIAYRQEHQIYSIHWSAISYKDKGILFWGSISGAGKTSLAIKLAQKKNFFFLWDENIYINSNGEILNWVTNILFNKPSLWHFFEKIPWNIQLLHSKQRPQIKIIIQPLVVKWGVLELIERDKIKIKFHIYEELSRRIRWVSRLINNWSIPVKSLDTKALSSNRIKMTSSLTDHILWYTIKWDINVIQKEIEKIILSL